jgi:hypothetical protein
MTCSSSGVINVLVVPDAFNSKYEASSSFGGAQLFWDIKARVELDASNFLLPYSCYSQRSDAYI